MAFELDIFVQQLNKSGEQLCGDTVQIARDDSRTIVVLSDGLGSGVKANILSTLTARILVEMLRADASLDETVKTVIGTLPVCKVRQLAYATFTAAAIDSSTGQCHIVNFDNPPTLWLRRGRSSALDRQARDVLGRKVWVIDTTLHDDDFLGIISDGVLHAGVGKTMNMQWNWNAVARYSEDSLRHYGGDSRSVVRRVMGKVSELYAGDVGDDASFVGILVRPQRTVVLFTGPPLDPGTDERVVKRFLDLGGRHVVCGGTTGNIVARYLDEEPELVLRSMRRDVPPIARMREVDLLTEGILTMRKALEHLRRAVAGHPLPQDDSGDALLALELMQADRVHLMLGQKINEYYQNPALPADLSLRGKLVEDMVGVLRAAGKQVIIERY